MMNTYQYDKIAGEEDELDCAASESLHLRTLDLKVMQHLY
jgi:hypothetical protein